MVCPNPFYQIYEGAALLAGATPALPQQPAGATATPSTSTQLPETVWRRAQLVYVCSPANPTGYVMTLADWKRLFALSDRYGFVIASDECYSEIYFDEAHPPLGALRGRAAARARGLSAAHHVLEPVQALQRAGHALGFRRRRRRRS